MKIQVATFITILLISIMPLGAGLIDNGNGTVTDNNRGIMWLRSGNESAQLMTQMQAILWADSLTFAGYSDWRLPSALNLDGSGPCFGFNCTDGEMGHLYYTELGNAAGGPVTNLGPFVDVGITPNDQTSRYWTETQIGGFGGMMFVFSDGAQGGNASTQLAGAWAVRAIPEPSSFSLAVGCVSLLLLIRGIRGRPHQHILSLTFSGRL